jgi:hypothetical protein
MGQLAPDTLERLVKLLGMLGSAHDGERAAAGLKAHELVRRHGLTWSDILLAAPAPPPKLGWRDKLTACAAPHCLKQPRARVRLVAGAVARHPDRKAISVARPHLRELP